MVASRLGCYLTLLTASWGGEGKGRWGTADATATAKLLLCSEHKGKVSRAGQPGLRPKVLLGQSRFLFPPGLLLLGPEMRVTPEPGAAEICPIFSPVPAGHTGGRAPRGGRLLKESAPALRCVHKLSQEEVSLAKSSEGEELL